MAIGQFCQVIPYIFFQDQKYLTLYNAKLIKDYFNLWVYIFVQIWSLDTKTNVDVDLLPAPYVF